MRTRNLWDSYLPWGRFTTDTCPLVRVLSLSERSLIDTPSVKRSLAENELTVVSIFVNPAQFAPSEDLATYPRTLPHDLSLLSSLKYLPIDTHSSRTPSAVFLPSVKDMYPSGISQDVAEQKGTFVEVKGYGEQMEGRSRPTFFRGVATVVTKLFNIIQVRTVPGVNVGDECSSRVISQPMRTSARRTSSRRSSCAALLAICTSLTPRPVGCTSSPPRVTPQMASLSLRAMYTSLLPSANELPHSTRPSRRPHAHGPPGQASGTPYDAHSNNWK